MKLFFPILIIFSVICFCPTFAQSSPAIISQNQENITITINSKDPITYSYKKTGNILTITAESKDIINTKTLTEQIDKGLVQDISISFETGKATIKINSISIPKWTAETIKSDSVLLIKIFYSLEEERANVKTRAIKTKNTYHAGDSLIRDLSVIIDASEKAPVRKFTPYIKTHIADMKLGLKNNLALIISKTGKPQPIKLSKKSELLDKGFLPFEKREIINLNFDNKEIAEILKVLTEKTDKNLIVAPQVKGKKSIEFKDMSPEEAMSKLLEPTGFEIRIRKDTILVGPQVVLNSIISQQTDEIIKDKSEKQIFLLKKIRGEKVLRTLDKAFSSAKYTFYPKLNAFEITSDRDTLDEIKEYFSEIDV